MTKLHRTKNETLSRNQIIFLFLTYLLFFLLAFSVCHFVLLKVYTFFLNERDGFDAVLFRWGIPFLFGLFMPLEYVRNKIDNIRIKKFKIRLAEMELDTLINYKQSEELSFKEINAVTQILNDNFSGWSLSTEK